MSNKYLYGENRVVPADVITKDQYKKFLRGPRKPEMSQSKLSLLLNAYVVADVLGSTDYLNEIMIRLDFTLRTVQSKSKNRVPILDTKSIEFVMDHTVDVSPLRQYCLDLIGLGLVTGRFCLPNVECTSSGSVNVPPHHEALYLEHVLRQLKHHQVEMEESPRHVEHYLSCREPETKK